MKSCAEDHLIRQAKSLRLGTLEYFRNNANPEIGDDLEAEMVCQVRVTKPTTYPSVIFNSIMVGGMAIGKKRESLKRPFVFDMKTLIDGVSLPGFIEILECDLRYKTAGSDALIFCMTISREKAAKPSLGYSSAWNMRRTSASRFGQKLLKKLNRELALAPEVFLHPAAIEKELNTKNLKFTIFQGPVIYREKFSNLLNPSQKELQDLGKMLENSDMYKSHEYAHQFEYRFCFRLVAGNRLIRLRPDLEYFDIAADEFRRYSFQSAF